MAQPTETINYVVSHIRGFFLNSSSGRLYLAPDKMYFKANAVNFNLRTYEWTYDQIAGYKKGFATYFTIRLSDGRTETFQLYKKNTLIQSIEKYRKGWYEAQGKTAPEII